jgi:hypothetical protein
MNEQNPAAGRKRREMYEYCLPYQKRQRWELMRRYLSMIFIITSVGILLGFSSGWCAEPVMQADKPQAPTQDEALNNNPVEASKPEEVNKPVEANKTDEAADKTTEPTGKAADVLDNASDTGKNTEPDTKGTETIDKKGDVTDINAVDLITELKARKIISDDEANWLMQKYQGQNVQFPGSTPIEKDKFIKNIVSDLESQMRQEVQAQIKDDLKAQILKEARMGNWLTPALPEWASKFKFSGDLRLRYQGDYFGDDNAEMLNPSDPTKILNTQVDRSRLRLRIRINTLVQVADQVDTGITISTGSTTNPVSTNATFGDYLNKDTIVLDKAWMRYKPMPELSLTAGRMPNPWFSTDLVWDSNVNFEGAALQFDTQLGRPLRTFLTVGAFPIQEVELSSHDKWLFGYQTGLKLNMPDIVSMKVGAAYYNYTNIEGKLNDPKYPGLYDWTAPQFQQMGNTLFDIDPSSSYKLALASGYNEMNFTTLIDIAIFDPVHVTLTGDYVRNLGFDKKKVAARTGNERTKKDVTGYQAGLSVGYVDVAEFGEWKFSVARKRIGADAVLDAFTDSNFHGGGTNAQGYLLKGELGLTRNVTFATQWYSANEINGPQLSIDTLQVDLNVKF